MKKIRIGQISLSFHRASAAYIKYLLELKGYEVEIKEAPHEAAFEMLAKNEIDLLMSAWLPGSHGKYLQPFADQTVKLGVIYEPYCIWGVPEYSSTDLLSVADLQNETISQNVEKAIYSINPGAGISRFSIEIMGKYNLRKSGFTLDNLNEDAFFSYVENSLAEKKVIVIPFWHPQSLHHKYTFRELKEPFGLLRKKDQATVVIRREYFDQLDPVTSEMLRNVYLGNEKVSALDYYLYEKGLSIKEALAAASINIHGTNKDC
jgi:glycine betaine/proline transport system substrate-binding protein